MCHGDCGQSEKMESAWQLPDGTPEGRDGDDETLVVLADQ